MKQLLQNLRDGQTVVVEVPVPSPRPGMALMRTAASLVSAGTERMVVEFAEKSLIEKARSRPDLVRQTLDKARREGLLTTAGAVFNRLDQPMALGYSSAGTVVEAGLGLEGFKPGDRVACAGGGYAVHAEYAVVPRNLLVHLPDQVGFEAGAFVTLGAIALQGFRLANPQVGERVAVIGLGLLGLLSVGIARAAGCQVFGVDLDPARLLLGEKMGAQTSPRKGAEEAGRAISQGKGFDAVLICADTPSNDPVELAGALARDRGVVVAVGAVGLQLPRKIYYEKELQFIVSRSYGPGRYDPDYEAGGRDYPYGYVRWTEGRNLEAVVELLASGRLDVASLISHRFPIDDAPRAYELITGKTGESFLGVLLTYPQAESRPVERRAVNPQASSQTVPARGELALGVLGAGNYASSVFLPAVKAVGGIARVAVASASGLSARNAARRFDFGYASSSEEEVLEDKKINVVAVLTRHNLHARQALRALELGKHVFCEKPLAITLEELEQISAALQAGPAGLLTVGFNRRFSPFGVRLKAFLDGRSEPLTAHYRVNAGFLPDAHWLHDPAQGGGRIIGEACHFVDFLTFLVGSPPVKVDACGLPDGGRYHEDNVQLTFSFADGSIGTVIYLANGDKTFPKERLEVFCAGRVAVLDDFRSLELIHDGRREGLRSRLRQDKGHRAGWEAFLKAVRAGGPPPIPYDHLLGVTRATFAALRSLRGGRAEDV
jgi:predicted dehydrogenase/threonine dehydrogenase-like Zn-dependent dehydrogenase